MASKDAIPRTMKQVRVHKLGTDFCQVTKVDEVDVPTPGENQVLVKTRYVGINASDVNYSAGKYNPALKPPFPAGLEGMGEVVKCGTGVKNVNNGNIVVYLHPGSFGEYVIVPAEKVMVVDEARPEYLSIILSGLTAAISLQEEGGLDILGKGPPPVNDPNAPRKKVLVTAAAGGTGQFAVLLAKMAGCYVIGTCSTEEKKKMLKDELGCDEVINYKEEDIEEYLSKHHKETLDLVYESVGGHFFNAALKNLNVRGRLIVIGMVSKYHDGMDISDGSSYINIPLVCLRKSASVKGFFMPHYMSLFKEYIGRLITLYKKGDLKIKVDIQKGGISGVQAAVDALFKGNNTGKLVVEIA